jgi:predicted glycoside hydrolase/deacetylase ChbG (UPF0249 family)
MTAVKRLIVNADDFGRTSGINVGIIRAHREGIVTSASLMVTQTAAEQAAALAKENPNLGVGVHFAWTGGRPLLDPDQVRSLVDARGSLPRSPEGLALAELTDILAEARAHLRLFRELMGRPPTHFDTHHHAHRLPLFLEAVMTLAWETGIPVRSVTAEMRQRFRHERIATTDHLVEDFHGDGASLDNLVHILGGLPLGTTELVCHPGLVDAELRESSRYAEPRERELEALTDREVRQAIQAGGVRLIHYGSVSGNP